jgi:hypothetical protein
MGVFQGQQNNAIGEKESTHKGVIDDETTAKPFTHISERL